MIRKIIRIDEAKCNGCGACAAACHEGAIGMVIGIAKLLREDYCDGLGDCLPACPTNAISFEEREAPAYDEAAVLRAKAEKHASASCACPGMKSRQLSPEATSCAAPTPMPSQLRQWPVQIKLVPLTAPYFQGADLLIAADCTAYAYASFLQDFIRGRGTLVGCPKLDDGNYAEKLARIFALNEIRSVTVARMEVPCCGGLENSVRRAQQACGKSLPCEVVTISVDGTRAVRTSV